MKKLVLLLFILINSYLVSSQDNSSVYIMVLGIAQDAGYPQMGCEKQCCNKAWINHNLHKYTSCIAIVDPISKEQWIIDATPDIKYQLNLLNKTSGINQLNGIFLTHAHIGHYTGLMHFGKEVMGSNNLPVYCMPRMSSFLKNNGPWSQLVSLKNIEITEMHNNDIIQLNERISISPFLVPHRDEFSETVGYKIISNNKSVIFIPDIDKWNKWEVSINDLIKEVDYAFLDATFFNDGELNRDMSEIPHPFVTESMNLFERLDLNHKKKIYFIHFNHTNPLLIDESDEQKEVLESGFNISIQGKIISLK